MCDPLATASLGLQIFGGLNSASAAEGSANANKSTLLLQAGIADLNAKAVKDTASMNAKSILQTADINARMAESSAQRLLLSGQRDVQKSRLATAQLRSTQRASMAANGIVLDEGTSGNITTSTDLMGEVDAQTIEQNAITTAWGYRTQSALETAQAKTVAANVLAEGDIKSAQYTAQAGYSRAGGNAIDPGAAYSSSLIGSAGSVASSWYQFKKNGAFA